MRFDTLAEYKIILAEITPESLLECRSEMKADWLFKDSYQVEKIVARKNLRDFWRIVRTKENYFVFYRNHQMIISVYSPFFFYDVLTALSLDLTGWTPEIGKKNE